MACSDGRNTEPTEVPSPQEAISLVVEPSDSEELKAKKQEFNSIISEIYAKYKVGVKVAEPSDFPYINHHSGHILDPEKKWREKYYRISFLQNLNARDLGKLNEYLKVINERLPLYFPVFGEVLKNIYLTGKIQSDIWLVQWFAWYYAMALDASFTGEPYELGKIFHHEYAHLIHQSEWNDWPFKVGIGTNTMRGFAREYGMKNAFEDVATIGEELFESVTAFRKKNDAHPHSAILANQGRIIQQGNKFEKRWTMTLTTIFERMKTDHLLANKVMFMTWSYYDRKVWKFIWDFSPVEFREFFGVPHMKVLPFYSRMKKKGLYDFEYWNQVMESVQYP
jgi:hypothetical protein